MLASDDTASTPGSEPSVTEQTSPRREEDVPKPSSPPELVGSSSFQMAPDSIDTWEYRIINESFRYLESSTGDLLLRQTVDQKWTRLMASPKSKLTVEAFDPSSIKAPRWTLHDSSDTGGVWERNYYRTVKRGCCSGETTTALYDLDTGDHVITADAGILEIERDAYFDPEQDAVVPRKTWFVGYRSMRGMRRAPTIAARDSVFGVLQVADTKGIASRVLLSVSGMTSEETFSSREYAAFSPKMELIGQATPDSVRGIRPYGESVTVRTSGRDSLSIRLPQVGVVIPIHEGRLTLRGATSPAEIDLEIEADSVP